MTPDQLSVVVSGIKPTGRLHLGNYFGAIRQHLALQMYSQVFFFIANYHALTTIRERERLEVYSLSIAFDYLALGLDPSRAALFLQSDVPEVTELATVFHNLVTVPELQRGVSYKDAVAKDVSPNADLLNYPVLQAADILLYGGTHVPVGADQRQHVEVSRDIARRFNRAFCPDDPLFPEPEALVLEEVAVVPGIDGRKMSKSYGNTIGIFDEGEELRRKVMRIVTDATPLEAPKDPEGDNVFALIKLFAPPEERERIAAAYRAGGYGYAEAKRELIGLMGRHFAEARERRRALKRDEVMDVLLDGTKRARQRAERTIAVVRERTGLLRAFHGS